MKTSSIVILLGLLFTLGSCKKEVIPDRYMLEDTSWVSKDASINAEVSFTINEMFLTKDGQSATHYFYSVRNNSLYLYPEKIYDPDNFSTHSIYLNEKTNELRIQGLGGSISEPDGFAFFVKK